MLLILSFSVFGRILVRRWNLDDIDKLKDTANSVYFDKIAYTYLESFFPESVALLFVCAADICDMCSPHIA